MVSPISYASGTLISAGAYADLSLVVSALLPSPLIPFYRVSPSSPATPPGFIPTATSRMAPAPHDVSPPAAGGPAFALAVGASPLPASPNLVVTFVRVTLHDGQIIRGTFVALDQVMNPLLCDCVELYPQASHHASGPLVFPIVAIAYL